MLTKKQVEAIKGFYDPDSKTHGEPIEDTFNGKNPLLELIKTIEEMEEAIKHYAKDEVNGHKAGRLLAKYKGEV